MYTYTCIYIYTHILVLADSWIPRCPDLIRLTGTHPLNCEPPLEQLMKNFVTPNHLHYVRCES